MLEALENVPLFHTENLDGKSKIVACKYVWEALNLLLDEYPTIFGTRIFNTIPENVPVIDVAELLEQVTSARLLHKVCSCIYQTRSEVFHFLRDTFSDKILVRKNPELIMAPKVTSSAKALPSDVNLSGINNLATVSAEQFPEIIKLLDNYYHLQMRDKSNSSDLYECNTHEKVLEGYECKSGKQIIDFESLHVHLAKLNAPEGWKSIMIMVAMETTNILESMCSTSGSMLFGEGTYYKATFG
ncbi:hypothetical protein AKO1_003753, partial [Acrasis kona]